MIGMDILKPAVVLMAWTMLMWAWMYATRIPAMRAAKLDPNDLSKPGAAKLDALLPPQVQWKAHNYNHLHEAPTVFYAVAIVLAIVGEGAGYNLWLGWLYVAVRILHSLVQATVNVIVLRFAIFAVSSLVLAVLVARAAMAVF
jgi:hypothetical protein